MAARCADDATMAASDEVSARCTGDDDAAVPAAAASDGGSN